MIKPLIELARLALALGRTNRITRHEDGERFETVAEHTVMLAWCALSIAEAWFPWLDRGEVARFALCHDAPEALCGDTPTLVISEAERAAKDEREAASIAEIEARTAPALPWLIQSIETYERLKGAGRAFTGEGSASNAAKAAAFVHAVDKMMPKLTHILNGGVTLADSGISRVDLEALLDRQRATIERTLPNRISGRLAELQSLLSALTLELLESEFEMSTDDPYGDLRPVHKATHNRPDGRVRCACQKPGSRPAPLRWRWTIRWSAVTCDKCLARRVL